MNPSKFNSNPQVPNTSSPSGHPPPPHHHHHHHHRHHRHHHRGGPPPFHPSAQMNHTSALLPPSGPPFHPFSPPANHAFQPHAHPFPPPPPHHPPPPLPPLHPAHRPPTYAPHLFPSVFPTPPRSLHPSHLPHASTLPTSSVNAFRAPPFHPPPPIPTLAPPPPPPPQPPSSALYFSSAPIPTASPSLPVIPTVAPRKSTPPPPAPTFSKPFPPPKIVVPGFNQEALSKMSKLFVGNISEGIGDEWMERILNACGTLESWKRAPSSDGRLKGFGFATFSSPEAVILMLKVVGDDPSTSLELPSMDRSPWKRLLLKVDENNRKLLAQYKTTRGHQKGDFEREKATKEFIQDILNGLCLVAPERPSSPSKPDPPKEQGEPAAALMPSKPLSLQPSAPSSASTPPVATASKVISTSEPLKLSRRPKRWDKEVKPTVFAIKNPALKQVPSKRLLDDTEEETDLLLNVKKSRVVPLPQVPDDLDTILSYPIVWTHLTDTSTETIQSSVLNHVSLFLGKQGDDDLSEFLVLRILQQCSPQDLIREVEFVFGEDTPVFVGAIWKEVIRATL